MGAQVTSDIKMGQFSGKIPFAELVDQYDKIVGTKYGLVLVFSNGNRDQIFGDLVDMLFARGEEVYTNFEKTPPFVHFFYSASEEERGWHFRDDVNTISFFKRKYVYVNDFDLVLDNYCYDCFLDYETCSFDFSCASCDREIQEDFSEPEKLYFARTHQFLNVPVSEQSKKRFWTRIAQRILASICLVLLFLYLWPVLSDLTLVFGFDVPLSWIINVKSLGLLGGGLFLLYRSGIPILTLAKYSVFVIGGILLIYLVILLVLLYMCVLLLSGSGESSTSSSQNEEVSRDSGGYVYYGPTPEQQNRIAHLERQYNYMVRTGRRK